MTDTLTIAPTVIRGLREALSQLPKAMPSTNPLRWVLGKMEQATHIEVPHNADFGLRKPSKALDLRTLLSGADVPAPVFTVSYTEGQASPHAIQPKGEYSYRPATRTALVLDLLDDAQRTSATNAYGRELQTYLDQIPHDLLVIPIDTMPAELSRAVGSNKPLSMPSWATFLTLRYQVGLAELQAPGDTPPDATTSAFAEWLPTGDLGHHLVALRGGRSASEASLYECSNEFVAVLSLLAAINTDTVRLEPQGSARFLRAFLKPAGSPQ